jgi:hypothetical protein
MEIDALSSLFKKKCRRADIFEESFESITIAHSNDLPLARKYFQFERRGFTKFSHAIDHTGSRELLHGADRGIGARDSMQSSSNLRENFLSITHIKPVRTKAAPRPQL